MTKKKTSIQLSEQDKELLERLAQHLGVSQSAVFALSLRCLAKQEKVKV